MFVINHNTVTPVRREPSESCEQLTQLLFGEVCEVMDSLPRWTKIRSTQDGQEGWVDFKMLTLIDDKIKNSFQKVYIENAISDSYVVTPLAIATNMETGDELILTFGTRLPNYIHGIFEVLNEQYLIDPKYVNNPEFFYNNFNGVELLNKICSVAQTLLNAPYLWGGKNVMGIDCSGFTQVVYRVFGVNLLRNASEQITQGKDVLSLAEALPGDLVFFDHFDRDPKATNISHVGMLLDNKKIIHCSGCVHVDDIDDIGIYLVNGELTHHLVKIKRYINI